MGKLGDKRSGGVAHRGSGVTPGASSAVLKGSNVAPALQGEEPAPPSSREGQVTEPQLRFSPSGTSMVSDRLWEPCGRVLHKLEDTGQ